MRWGGGGGDRESAPAARRKAPHFVVPPAPPPASNQNDGEEAAANTPMIARTVELQIVVKKFDDARSDGAIHSAASPRLCGNFKHQ